MAFLSWMDCCKSDKEIVKRIRYIVIGGDGIDGIGVYPGQERNLIELDLLRQYNMLADLIECMPKNAQIFLIPGNHDPIRQALPQPAIPEKYSKRLYGIDNLRLLGNPATLTLSGVSVLSYHGTSLDDVLASTPGLSYSRPTEGMRLLLKARHLAPMYGRRTPIGLDCEDHLVIEDVPDIFHSGHTHTLDTNFHRGTLMINSGTWQCQTEYQANMGVVPTPALVPIVNLSTLEGIVKDFRANHTPTEDRLIQ
jgi:DNA polymerase II small subunit